MILLCAATTLEARACERGVRVASERFEILCTGMGVKRAREALENRLLSTPRPEWIISTGLAGSQSPDIEFADWVTASTLQDSSGKTFPVQGLPRFFPKLKDAPFVTVETVETGPNTAGRVVDMESCAWAQVAESAKIPFGVLRLVSDSPRYPMPKSIGCFAAAAGDAPLGLKARSIFTGAKEMLCAPREMAQFLGRSAKLPAMLEKSWREWARLQ